VAQQKEVVRAVLQLVGDCGRDAICDMHVRLLTDGEQRGTVSLDVSLQCPEQQAAVLKPYCMFNVYAVACFLPVTLHAPHWHNRVSLA
jgi:hypothetical protein